MPDTVTATTIAPDVPLLDRVAEAEALRVAAHAKWELVKRQLSDSEAALRIHHPGVAMRAGRDATEAAAAYAEAEARCGYLADSVDHAKVIAYEAQQEVERIRNEVIHGLRLRAAVATRLDALERILEARAALASAEQDYSASADMIRHAIGSA